MEKYLINCSFGYYTSYGNWVKINNYAVFISIPEHVRDFAPTIIKELEKLNFKEPTGLQFSAQYLGMSC